MNNDAIINRLPLVDSRKEVLDTYRQFGMLPGVNKQVNK